MAVHVQRPSRLRRYRVLIVVSFSLTLVLLAATLDLWNVSRRFERVIEGYTATVRATPQMAAIRTDLPPLLRAYIHRFEGSALAHARWVRIEQRGEMRLAPDGAWLPFQAVQYVSVSQPAFLWRGTVRMLPNVNATVIDGVVDSQGILESRWFNAVPMAKVTGTDILKAELQRYVAELPGTRLHWR